MTTKNMPCDSFRVGVDLTRLFDDDRSWCYIYVEPSKFPEISHVETHLQTLFEISSPVRLFVGKYLLPSSESIQILSVGDVIRVVGDSSICQSSENCANIKKQKHSCENEKANCLQKKLGSVNASPVIVNSHVNTSGGPAHFNGFRNVCDPVVDGNLGAASQVDKAELLVQATEDLHSTIRDNAATKVTDSVETAGEIKQHYDVFLGNVMQDDVVNEDLDFSVLGGNKLKISAEPNPSDCDVDMKTDSDVVQKKRKRSRHRKRKIMMSSSVGEVVSLIRSSIGTSPVVNSEKCYTSSSDNHNDRKHIRFSEDGDSSITGESNHDVCDDSTVKVSFNRHLQSPQIKPVSNWDVKIASDSAPQTQNFVNLLSLRHKAAPLVFDRKQAKQKPSEPLKSLVAAQVPGSNSVNDQKSNSVCGLANESVLLEQNVDPNNYPVLNSAPKKHDVILFKTLVLTENCIPQLSSYIMATVTDYCSVSCDVKLDITRNGQELCQQPLKFATQDQTDVPVDDLTINWNEIHETRLVSRAT